jgi:two-component system KDP operon response regulator KdpE
MRPQLRILVVDDEPQIHRFLRPSLAASGFDVVSAATGAEAQRAFAAAPPDAIILDLGLPDMDGKEVITAIRKQSAVPIIVLSARDRETEKIDALDLGADDYINKPFSIGEFLARVRSVLRRQSKNVPTERESFDLGTVHIDTLQHTVTRASGAVHLTPKEFDLLVLLARHAGKVLTHRHLLTQVWGPAHGADTQYLRVFIGQLRQKIEDDPAAPRLIITEPGVGYRAVDREAE